ncbi:radical SAM protein [Saccharicrinis sp. FJH62]|uniref:radical SAM protein n=1 Tax=Saccharicrinis sp. FJH62 TaxID=3344657 RepID=UPI0035D4BE23
MKAFIHYLNDLVSEQKDAFSKYQDIRWINPYEADVFQIKRDELLSKNPGRLFKGTKIFHNGISNGCSLCGKGMWSCLFITGKCNAGCFYCPAPQQTDELPTSQGLTFETPEAYAEYVNYFGFKGVSFSGGEPLLYFERTLEYLKAVRSMCDPDIYIWLYTNGILASEEKFRLLAEAGLNEIRFDIGATRYSLENVKKASGIIPTVTIEIPSVPEEKNLIIELLPDLVKVGVKHLNLHQLRLTDHNAAKLLKRNYTYIPAEKPVVLESELAALEIIDYARDNQIDIGINYCSFYFKNRFQKAGFRTRVNTAMGVTGDMLTEKGNIRLISADAVQYSSYFVKDKSDMSASDHTTLKLAGKTYHVYRSPVTQAVKFMEHQQPDIVKLTTEEPDQIPDDPVLFKIWQNEYIETNLRDY